MIGKEKNNAVSSLMDIKEEEGIQHNGETGEKCREI
jgi:hypothetical protein